MSGEYIFFSDICKYRTLQQSYKALILIFLGLVLCFMNQPANLIFHDSLVPKSTPLSFGTNTEKTISGSLIGYYLQILNLP